MSKSKKKASAKAKSIRTLLILLVITGALSAYVVNGYFKNRPVELVDSKTSENAAKRRKKAEQSDKADDNPTDEEEPETETEQQSDETKPSAKPDKKTEKQAENVIEEDEITKMMAAKPDGVLLNGVKKEDLC